MGILEKKMETTKGLYRGILYRGYTGILEKKNPHILHILST